MFNLGLLAVLVFPMLFFSRIFSLSGLVYVHIYTPTSDRLIIREAVVGKIGVVDGIGLSS